MKTVESLCKLFGQAFWRFGKKLFGDLEELMMEVSSFLKKFFILKQRDKHSCFPFLISCSCFLYLMGISKIIFYSVKSLQQKHHNYEYMF